MPYRITVHLHDDAGIHWFGMYRTRRSALAVVNDYRTRHGNNGVFVFSGYTPIPEW